jgi:hypothetical protein
MPNNMQIVKAEFLTSSNNTPVNKIKAPDKIKKSTKSSYNRKNTITFADNTKSGVTTKGNFKSKSIGAGLPPKPIKKMSELDKMYEENKNTSKATSLDDIAGYKDTGRSILEKLNSTLQLPPIDDDVDSAFRRQVRYYNRFKAPEFDSVLRAGFAHVFFVKPQCNILNNDGSLVEGIKNNDLFTYAKLNCPEILAQLSKFSNVNSGNDFMFSLSNNIKSFTVNEEGIGYEKMGKTYTGHSVAYGKNDIESKAASSLSISFKEDRNFHIYQIHKLWVEYINGVYQGLFSPTKDDIYNKILDYPSAIYYIITAEDGETVLFWSKYYGVFPTTIPSDQLSWNEGSVLRGSEMTLNVTYQYSWKDDYNPYIIREFNKNAFKASDNKRSVKYAPTFDPNVLHTGLTWVGTPYIETVSIKDSGNNLADYYYRLRFVEPDQVIS